MFKYIGEIIFKIEQLSLGEYSSMDYFYVKPLRLKYQKAHFLTKDNLNKKFKYYLLTKVIRYRYW